MSEQVVAPSRSRAALEGAQRAADFIVQAVGDVDRPTANVGRRGGLDHIPGDRSFFDFVMALRGVITRGNAYYVERIARFGPVYAQEDGEGTAVFVADPGAIALMAKNQDQVWSTALGWRSVFEGVPPTPTLDFPTALDFGLHQQARRLLTPAFSASALDSYAETLTPMFAQTIEEWGAQRTVKFKRAARALFGRAGARIFMGIEDRQEARHMEQALVDVWGAFQVVVKNAWLSPKFRKARRGYRTLLEHFRSKAGERRVANGTDLFSRLCREEHGAAWIDDDTVVRLFIGVMTAAFDTTAFGVTNVAYLLATHPEWQERLREGGRALPLGSTTRELPKLLPECDWTFKEGLRRFPVAAALLRRALRDTEIMGYAIPAGTQVYALTAPVLWDQQYFPDPLSFDPQRFSPERAEHQRLGAAFMPFGGGAHVCVGAVLAGLEASIFLHELLGRYRIRLARPYEARHQMTPLGCVSGDVELVFEPL
jgi:cytochrome P450